MKKTWKDILVAVICIACWAAIVIIAMNLPNMP